MPTATPRLGLKLQDTGSNLNLWGQILNVEAITLVDEAFGVTLISVASAADVVLSNTIYATNQARRDTVQITGTPGAPFNLIVPTFDKRWFIDNRTAFPVTVKMSSGAGAVVRAGDARPVYSDGTDCYVSDPTLDRVQPPAANVAMNAKRITGLADAVADQDAATKKQVDAVRAFAAGIANSGILAPGSVLNDYLRWGGDPNSGGTGWHGEGIPPLVAGFGTSVSGSFATNNMSVNVVAGSGANQIVGRDTSARIPVMVAPWQDRTASYTAVNGDQIRGNTAGGGFTVNLPASPVVDDMVVVSRIGPSALTVGRNGSTIAGLAEDHILDSNYALVTFVCTGTNAWRAIPGQFR